MRQGKSGFGCEVLASRDGIVENRLGIVDDGKKVFLVHVSGIFLDGTIMRFEQIGYLLNVRLEICHVSLVGFDLSVLPSTVLLQTPSLDLSVALHRDRRIVSTVEMRDK